MKSFPLQCLKRLSNGKDFLFYQIMTMIVLLFIVFILGFVAVMQTRFQRENLKHTADMNVLKNAISQLLIEQKGLNQKIHIVQDFDKQFKTSRKILSQEILALQYEFLNKISDQTSEFN